jgi:hypothetical protein
MSVDQPLFLACPHCEDAMKLVRTVPKLGGLRALFVFFCTRCNYVETKEQEHAPSMQAASNNFFSQ